MDKRQVNPFPVDTFPKRIQEIIQATHEHVGYPVDFISSAILFAAATAIGNTFKVYVKEGFIESAVVYMAIVGRAGTNKTQPIKFAIRPIRQRDIESYKVWQEQKQEYDLVASLPTKERVRQGRELPPKPIWPKTIMGDFTLEALVEVHSSNKRGLGVHADELASWFKNFTRYSQGSEMEFWLSSWSGTEVPFDRKSGDPTMITMPFISVIGSIQPSVLHELSKDSRSQNGFMDRILFVAPEGLSKQGWSDSDLPDSITTGWQGILLNLLEQPLKLDEFGCPEPTVLHFTPNARELLFGWQNMLTSLCNEKGDDIFTSICSKAEVYAPRFALILQLLFNATAEGEKDAVGVKAVEGGIRLAEYFINNAMKVRSHTAEPYALANLPANKRLLYEALPEKLTTATAVRVAGSHGIPERTLKEFLKNNKLFLKEKTGLYRKLF